MQILILYFSGTGNTHYAAHYLARRLERFPLEVLVCSIEQVPPDKLPAFDILGVGFPVHGGEAPIPLAAYIRSLPPGDGRGAFAFCTKGAFAAGASRRVLRRLTEQGYIPLGETGVNMPGIDLLPFLAKDSWLLRKMVEKDYNHLKPLDRLASRIGEIALAIKQGDDPTEFKIQLPTLPGSKTIEKLWIKLYDRMAIWLRGKFYADERCNLCRLCVRACPAGNIQVVDGRIRFGDRCYLCLRCLHQCPQEAIQLGQGTVGKARWRGPMGDFNPLVHP